MTTPAVVIRPIEAIAGSVNQSAPSGPVVIPRAQHAAYGVKPTETGTLGETVREAVRMAPFCT